MVAASLRAFAEKTIFLDYRPYKARSCTLTVRGQFFPVHPPPGAAYTGCGICGIFSKTHVYRVPSEMPYKDVERQREACRTWNRLHPEKVKGYKKTRFIRRAIAQRRLPQPHSIQRHEITPEELNDLARDGLSWQGLKLADDG